MTQTHDRRALLGAIATAPLALAAPPAQAALPANLDELGVDDLLRLGAREACDGAFASLCAAALPAYEAELRAWALFHDANETAQRLAPFPAALEVPSVSVMPNGAAEHWIDQWAPANDPAGHQLRWLARAQLRSSLGREPTHAESRTHETVLRAQWDAWERANREAETACLVPDLRSAADIAADLYRSHFDAIMAHRPSSPHALRIKCFLRWAECDLPDVGAWRDIAADVEAALA